MQHFDETPDDSRPRNPWPRLLALGAVLLVSVFAVGACLVMFATTCAEREIRLTLTELEPGVPRFEPITSWGADDDGFTYGIWIAQIPEVGTRAYFSREVSSGCHLRWEATRRSGELTGAFADPCSEVVYSIEGVPIEGAAARHLDEFDVLVAVGEIVVSFDVLEVGDCVGTTSPSASEDAPICNPPGGATTRSVPRNTALADDFARR